MQFLQDAKRRYEALLECEATRPYAASVSDSLSSLSNLGKAVAGLRESFFKEAPSAQNLPELGIHEIIIIEDCALSFVDYLFSHTSMGEFDRAVVSERIRQDLLCKRIRKNRDAFEALFDKETGELPRNTPRDL